MGLVRCIHGWKNPNFKGNCSNLKQRMPETPIIYLTFNDFSPWWNGNPQLDHRKFWKTRLIRCVGGLRFLQFKGEIFQSPEVSSKVSRRRKFDLDMIKSWLQDSPCVLLIVGSMLWIRLRYWRVSQGVFMWQKSVLCVFFWESSQLANSRLVRSTRP